MHLLANALIAAGLVASHTLSVPVHGITHPGDYLPRLLHRLYQPRHVLPHLHQGVIGFPQLPTQ